MSKQVKINPVTLDIVKDSLIAVSNEIFYAFAQTSMSPIIYETLDYASGIADAQGRLLTQGNGGTGFIGMITPMLCAVVDKYGRKTSAPGMCISSTPHSSAAAPICPMWGWSCPFSTMESSSPSPATRPPGAI